MIDYIMGKLRTVIYVLLGGVVSGVIMISPAHATVISLDNDGEYSADEKLDFRQQKKVDAKIARVENARANVPQNIEALISDIPVTYVPSGVGAIPSAKPAHEYEKIIRVSSEKFTNITPDIVAAVFKVESNFDPKALSPKGAQGLMQLMPATAARYDLDDAYDPKQNITAGGAELSRLIDIYESLPLALAAYNAGEGAVEKYHGIPPYPETQNYVVKVLSEILSLQKKQIKALSSISLPRT